MKKAAYLALAALLITSCATGTDRAVSQTPESGLPPTQSEDWQFFFGRNLSDAFVAWEALKARYPDFPPLESVSVELLRSGDFVIVKFVAPPEVATRGGQSVLVFGPNYYEVRVEAGVVTYASRLIERGED